MMKRFLTASLSVMLSLSLVACNNDSQKPNLPAANSGDTSVLATDFQKHMNQSTSSNIYHLCETDNGFYFEYGGNSRVYFMDKKTGKTSVLCGKPDCTHEHSTDETCNAFINGNFLAYSNGKLYWSHNDYVQENGEVIKKGERLHCMDLDGSNHTVIQELDFVPGGDTGSYITRPIIHRGKIYFAYSGKLYVADLGADIEDATIVYGEEIVDNGSNVFNPNEMYYELCADGDNIFFMAKNVKQSDGTYKDTLYCYGVQSKELDKVWQVPEKGEVGTWDTTGVSVSQWYISNGCIYFYLSGNDIWRTDLSTGKLEKVVDLDIIAGAASFSDSYITVVNKFSDGFDLLGSSSALSGGDTIYIYDYDGKLVNECSLEPIYDDIEGVTDCNLLWVADGKVYIHVDATIVGVVNGNYSTKTTQRHFIYAVDIASGVLEKADWNIGNQG